MEINFKLMAKEANKVILEQELETAIQNEDCDLLNDIGRKFFESNEYVDQNIELATKAFQHSMEFGDKEIAVCYLTDIYEIYPHNVDDEIVMDIIYKAIDVGYAEAMFILGLKYAKGDGVVKDIDKATFWFEKSHIHNSINVKKLSKMVLGWDNYEEFSSQITYAFDHEELKVA